MQGDAEAKPELPPVDGVPIVEVETPIVEVVETIPPENIPLVEVPEGVGATVPEIPLAEIIPELETQPLNVSDQLIFEKLSETLGITVESYEDLKQKEVQVDPEVKQLLEWKEKTGLSLSKWSEFNKDFSKMGDLEVAKEILAQEYPSFTSEELEYSLRGYIYDELEDDISDKLKKSIALKKFASEGRKTLDNNRVKLIESQSPTNQLSQEDSELITFAKSVKEQEAKSSTKKQNYEQSISKASSELEAINLKLEDDVVIQHKVPQESKKALSEFIQEMPDWYNEDGTFNHNNIAKDSYKIQNFDALVKAAYEQGKSVATEGKLKSDNNITLDSNVTPQIIGVAEKGNINEVVSKLTGKKGSNFRFRKSKKQ
jgi:hypothetical protein